jgi:alpha-tubulin suppressor-like RCC1 family protein
VQSTDIIVRVYSIGLLLVATVLFRKMGNVLTYVTAVIATAVGPSGKNDEYLFMLDSFLSESSSSLHLNDADHTGDSDTKELAAMTRHIQKNTTLFHLFGVGSNQHEQLLLKNNQIPMVDKDQIHEFTETVLAIPKESVSVEIKSIHAGGGHSALVTTSGSCYLWGSNEFSQLGRLDAQIQIHDQALPMIQNVFSLKDLKVNKVSLGHDHSLVLEQTTGWVYAFGNNGRYQCGQKNGNDIIESPTIPSLLMGVRCIDIAAGLFHSAAVSENGELITFGCTKFGQCLSENSNRWRPDDGSRLVKVSCGSKHTIVLDEYGRIWTFGENTHGQLGRTTPDSKISVVPELVDHPLLSEKGSGCFHIDCGWSHNMVLVKCNSTSKTQSYGWGRNDRGQLGTGTTESPIFHPQLVHEPAQNNSFIQIFCGSESSIALDEEGVLWSCGWNEHGNLALNHTLDTISFSQVEGLPIGRSHSKRFVAMGGAHTIVACIP